jgi:hypothetical protein
VLIVRIEETLPSGGTVTKDGLIETEGPVGEIAAVKSTRPEKRLNELIVMLDVAEFPGRIVTLLGLGLREKPGGTPESLHPVSGCNSHPDRLWSVEFARTASQKMKPCTSIVVTAADVCETNVLLSQVVRGPQYAAAFQSRSISEWIRCMQPGSEGPVQEKEVALGL